MKLFHRTSPAAAAKILRNGFADARGDYGTGTQHSGMWLSDAPLDANDGVLGGALLTVEIDLDRIADFEWIEEGKGYREWLVPASIVA